MVCHSSSILSAIDSQISNAGFYAVAATVVAATVPSQIILFPRLLLIVSNQWLQGEILEAPCFITDLAAGEDSVQFELSSFVAETEGLSVIEFPAGTFPMPASTEGTVYRFSMEMR